MASILTSCKSTGLFLLGHLLRPTFKKEELENCFWIRSRTNEKHKSSFEQLCEWPGNDKESNQTICTTNESSRIKTMKVYQNDI